MVVNGKALVEAERARIKAETANGIPAADKARRLDQLSRQIMQACARHELSVSASEGDGFLLLPRSVHPEFVIATVKQLEQIAR